MAGGRPRIFNSVEEIDSRIAEYKKYLKKEDKPPTIAGLAYYLQIDRQTLYNYEKQDEYFGTIKRYREWVMMNLEEAAIVRGNGGTVFVMKNYGYTDKQEIEHSEQTVTIVNSLPRCD